MNEQETVTTLAEKLPILLPNMSIEDISLKVPIDKRSRADVMVKVRTGDLRKSLLIEGDILPTLSDGASCSQKINYVFTIAKILRNSIPWSLNTHMELNS